MLKKKRKKRENISKKKDKQLHLVFNVWLSASIFHVFGVFLICRSVQTGCVLDFLKRQTTQLGLDHYLFPSVVIR